jgi:bifunctional non-homologous end joining protein LigD
MRLSPARRVRVRVNHAYRCAHNLHEKDALAVDQDEPADWWKSRGGYTDPDGARKHFGALLVGFYEGKKVKFCGRVGTGFSEKLLGSLHSDLSKLQVESCPFFNVPTSGGSRWDQGLTPTDLKRCHWVKPKLVRQVKLTEWIRDERLRQPVFLGLREDKSAREVVREQVAAAIS